MTFVKNYRKQLFFQSVSLFKKWNITLAWGFTLFSKLGVWSYYGIFFVFVSLGRNKEYLKLHPIKPLDDFGCLGVTPFFISHSTEQHVCSDRMHRQKSMGTRQFKTWIRFQNLLQSSLLNWPAVVHDGAVVVWSPLVQSVDLFKVKILTCSGGGNINIGYLKQH